MHSPDEHGHNPSGNPIGQRMIEEDEVIDLRDIFNRLGRGLGQIIGLAMLGLIIAVVLYFVESSRLPVSTSSRVAFAFPGFEKGEYPDRSKFQPDDLRAPDIISEALKRLGLEDTEGFQSRIRGALDIEGIFPPSIIKERDRMQAAGQIPPTYVPDEYSIVLTLPRNFPLSNQQREQLLGQIVSIYRQNFWHTYADFPSSLGNAFATLRNADFPDYELILNEDLNNITAYLEQRSEDTTATQAAPSNETLRQSRSFRSPTTHLSFSDLLEQIRFFSQVKVNNALSVIYLYGLTRDRPAATEKMDYQLRSLEDEENKASEEETVVQALLSKAEERSQSYVLGIKSQAQQSRPESPVLDQGLIDSLLANDAYNYLVHEELAAGLKVKDIEAAKAALLERRKRMEGLPDQSDTDTQARLVTQVQKSLAELEPAYEELIDNIRKTNDDFARQQFGDAVRMTDAVGTAGTSRPMAMAGIAGGFLGLAAGMGLSLLGVYIGSAKKN